MTTLIDNTGYSTHGNTLIESDDLQSDYSYQPEPKICDCCNAAITDYWQDTDKNDILCDDCYQSEPFVKELIADGFTFTLYSI